MPEPIAVLSDVHSNIEALEAVIEDAKEQGIKRFGFLGDMVGYGPNPVEVLKRIDSINPEFVIEGNHEYFILTDYFKDDTGILKITKNAKSSLIWTSDCLNSSMPEYEDYFKRFKKAVPDSENKIIYSHTVFSKDDYEKFFYISDRESAGRILRRSRNTINVIGHTHVPAVYTPDIESGVIYFEGLEELTKKEIPEHDKTISIPHGSSAIVNMGSVGQPRDEDPRACYAITEGRNFTFRKVHYDNELTCEKLKEISRQTGNPAFTILGTRLIYGD